MSHELITQGKSTAEKYGMLTKGGYVLAAVSGGADSVALFHFLLEMRGEYGFTLAVMHLNHGLRGAESDRDEHFVAGLCEKHGVRFVAEHTDIAKLAREKGLSFEEAGRVARYRFFERERCKCDENAVIAVGHTLDDSAETALLNMARGTALRGLCGIPPVRGKVIRPFIECEHRQIEDYLHTNGYIHIHDSSNDSDDYARNRLRHDCVPALKSVNTAFLRAVNRSFEALRQDADYLDDLAANAVRRIKSRQIGIVTGYSRLLYLELALPLRKRVLLNIAGNKANVDSARLARLDKLIEAGTGAEQLAENLRLVASRHEFRVESGETPEKKLRLVHMDYENYEEKVKSEPTLLNNALDCDKINGIISERHRLPGDKLKTTGRGCTKTLKNLCQEAGLAPRERETLKVLADESGVLWAEHFGAAERAAPGQGTTKVISVEIM